MSPRDSNRPTLQSKACCRTRSFAPPSPIGQLLWGKHIEAFEAAINHHHAQDAKDKDDEVHLSLLDAQKDVQQQLDEVIQPLPPTEVSWGGYFTGYGLLIVGLFAAMFFSLQRYRKTHSYSGRETAAAMMFLSPWIIGMIALTAGPILFSIVLSFTRYDVLSPRAVCRTGKLYSPFARWRFFPEPWQHRLHDDPNSTGDGRQPRHRDAAESPIRGIGTYRTGFYLPTIVPAVATTLLWTYLLNSSFGLINICLRWLFSTFPFHWIEAAIHHIHSPAAQAFVFTTPAWLTDPNWSKPSIILMGLWGAGGGMIIWLAGLQSIPTQLYEAATVDGASKWRQFVHVTVPMLSPYILFNAIMGVIGTMQIFSEAFIMTQGGPDKSTLFYAYHLFKTAFQYFNMGYASALAWMLFIIVFLLTLFQLWMSKKWVHYDQT